MTYHTRYQGDISYEAICYDAGCVMVWCVFRAYDIDGQCGGGAPMAAFLRVFVFRSFTSNWQVSNTYVALVDG